MFIFTKDHGDPMALFANDFKIAGFSKYTLWASSDLNNSTGWTPAVQYSSALVFQPLNIQNITTAYFTVYMQVKCKP